jgi:hypothetical protein
MTSTIVRLAALAGLTVLAGCVTGRGAPAAASRDWGETLTRAEAAASDHRYAEADRLLAEFAARYPDAQGARESAYWRGIIALEPGNRDGTPQMAVAFFEMYGRSGGALPHRLEAEILHDLAAKLQATSPATAVAVLPSTSSPAGNASNGASDRDLRAKDTEIQRLKDELAKANDELERIKRRLTAPTKP